MYKEIDYKIMQNVEAEKSKHENNNKENVSIFILNATVLTHRFQSSAAFRRGKSKTINL